MLVGLTSEEQDFVREMTEARQAIKKHNKRVSNYNDFKISYMGTAGEFCVAKLLSCHFDPFPHRGGDHHRRDLWRGPVTVSVKTRHGHLPGHFLFPTHQNPGEFPDDYGVVGRWADDTYSVLDVLGYFSYYDWQRYKTTLDVGGTRSGQKETRIGYREENLRPIQELILEMDMVPDAYFSSEPDGGYLGYLRDRDRRGGS